MQRWQLWVIAWCKVIDGVIGVATFGFIMPSLTLYASTYFAIKVLIESEQLNGRTQQEKS